MSTIEIENIKALPDGRMNAINAARYLGLAEKTLAMMRSAGTGPEYIKRGRVFYFKEDLDRWLMRDGKISCTSQIQV